MRTNFATNPDMEASGALVTTRTNLCTNPNMEAAGPLVTDAGRAQLAALCAGR